jgi:hypothetical protein
MHAAPWLSRHKIDYRLTELLLLGRGPVLADELLHHLGLERDVRGIYPRPLRLNVS